MGKSNTAIRQYLSDKTRFADIVNGTIFDGEQIIHPEDLEQVDGESDILLQDKTGKEKNVQRFRDITMRWKQKTDVAILACESQENIHYAMPVRTMLYDSLSYVEQIKQIWKKPSQEQYSKEEFLSQFRKDDHIYPVITIVLYYGLTEWDGYKDLYEMLQLNKDTKETALLKRYIPNYWINLIDIGNLEHIENFKTDLQKVFGVIQYRGNTEKMMQYVHNNEEYFQHVDWDTYCVMRTFLHSESKLKRILPEEQTKECVNMCKALDDLYNNGIELGRTQGIELGQEIGLKLGYQQARQEMVLKLLESMKLEEVTEMLGLELSEIEELKESAI